MKKILCTIVLSAFVLVFAAAANATVSWTDWTSATSTTAQGTLTIGATAVGVTYSGPPLAAQLDNIGTYYYTNASTYQPNPPPTAGIIELNNAGTSTITFSQAVTNPVIALVSWNGAVVNFGVPITFLSYGPSYWGSGSPTLIAGGTGFIGNGELHGVVEVPGTFTSITFTDTVSENWHGLTVGAAGLAPVPIPGALLLFGPGLVGLAAIRRRFKA